MEKDEIIEIVGAGFLGFSLTRIFGFVNGLTLCIAMISFYVGIKWEIRYGRR